MSSVRTGIDELDPMREIEAEVDSVYDTPPGEPMPLKPAADLDSGNEDPPRWTGPTR